MTRLRLVAVAITFLTIGGPGTALAQYVSSPPRDTREAPPWGQRIQAHDGDVIMVDGDDRVRIVRRRQANMRVIANAEERWVVVLADFGTREAQPDGRVDRMFNWRQIDGRWPLAERWEGAAVLEEYHAPGQSPTGVGIVFPEGRVQFLPGGSTSGFFVDAKALAVLHHRSGGSSTTVGTGFDDAERRAIAELAGSAQSNSVTMRASDGRVMSSLRLEAGEPTSYTSVAPGPASGGPVRVGGSIPMPRKIIDVPAVYPEAARQAGVAGPVILEITLAGDGTVTEARILRGHPLLDQPALDAARQWRYETTLLDGALVPVRFTATVNFPK